MIRAMFLGIIVPLLMTPVAVAVDDPTLQDVNVEELWPKSNRGSDAAYERLLELGPETRVLAERILHPKDEVFHKWPQGAGADLIEAMRADAVPELISALKNSVDKEDRVRFMNHLESLGRMARPAGEILMTIALGEDSEEREAALKALATAQTKRDFLIPEAMRMLSSSTPTRKLGWQESGPNHDADLATQLLMSCPDKRAEYAIVTATKYHPSSFVRADAVRALAGFPPDSRVLMELLDDVRGDVSSPFGSSTAQIALQQIQGYDQLPADVAVGLIEKLYRESFEDEHLSPEALADAICRCPPTDPHATELVTHKLRPLLEDGAYIHNRNPRFIKVAAAQVVMKWTQKDETSVNFLATLVNEVNAKEFPSVMGIRDRDERAYAARVLGRLGPKAQEWLPMLHEVMARERSKDTYSELAEAVAWAIAQIDNEDTECLEVIRDWERIPGDWPEVERVLVDRAALLVKIEDVLPEVRDPQFIVDVRLEDNKWAWYRLLPHLDVVIPILLEHLKSDRMDVRIATAKLLGDWQVLPDITIPAISELLDDHYASVRAGAAESLAKFGPAAVLAIPKLEHATQDEYLTVKLAAEDALSLIQGIALE